jgi:hypothetical protein
MKNNNRKEEIMFPDKDIVDELKEEYPPGTNVELIEMHDDYQTLPKGLKGVVTRVDDIGTIHVKWENGSHLGIAYGEDSCKKVTDN